MDMDSFTTKEPRFRYNPNSNQESESSFSGTLQIHVHHARNIHNICIYEKQDVYAKLSLTYNPDETFSTKIIYGGGKNPDFDVELVVKINQPDAALKCEIWMMSRAKNYMDDQLLGFTLVPISSVYNKGKVTQDFDLSSTDLFHSPAGTVKLSLTLTAKSSIKMVPFADSEVKTSELLLDKKVPDDYYRIEIPDINVVNENQLMVSEYFAKNGTFFKPWLEKTDGSFLHLGAAPQVLVEDYEMGGNSSEEYRADSISISPDGSIQNSDFQSSTATSISDYRNSADSIDKTETPIVEKRTEPHKKNDQKKEIGTNDDNKCSVSLVRNMKLEADESAMQQHIVDMYMRSMHQFTESLAKMKLPMDLGKREGDEQGSVIQNDDVKIEIDQTKMKNKDNARVFYGSSAFF